jgi:hypothetical protein
MKSLRFWYFGAPGEAHENPPVAGRVTIRNRVDRVASEGLALSRLGEDVMNTAVCVALYFRNFG